MSGTSPTLPLEAYAGVSRNAIYGTATVALSSDRHLTIHYDASPTTVGDLEHWHYDSFVAVMRDSILGRIPVTFRLGGDGKVASVIFPLGGPTEWVRQ